MLEWMLRATGPLSYAMLLLSICATAAILWLSCGSATRESGLDPPWRARTCETCFDLCVPYSAWSAVGNGLAGTWNPKHAELACYEYCAYRGVCGDDKGGPQ